MKGWKIISAIANIILLSIFIACSVLALFNTQIKACGYLLNIYCFLMFLQFALTFTFGFFISLDVKSDFFLKIMALNFAISWAYLTFGACLLLNIQVNVGCSCMSIWLFIILWAIIGPPTVAFILSFLICFIAICYLLVSKLRQKRMMMNIDKLYEKLYGMSDKKIINFLNRYEGDIDKFGLTPKEEDIILDKFSLVCEINQKDLPSNQRISCIICREFFCENESVVLHPGCKHPFHPDCLFPWFVRQMYCPSCKLPGRSQLVKHFKNKDLNVPLMRDKALFLKAPMGISNKNSSILDMEHQVTSYGF